MKVKIKETGEVVKLEIIDPETGLNYAADFVGNHGGYEEDFTEDRKAGYYIATAKTVNWWKRLLKLHEYINNVFHELRKAVYDPNSNWHIYNYIEIRNNLNMKLEEWGLEDISIQEFDEFLAIELNKKKYEMKKNNDGSMEFVKQEEK